MLGESEGLSEGDGLGEGEGLADGDSDGLTEGLGLGDADSDTDGESEMEYGDALPGLIEYGVLSAGLADIEIDLDITSDRRFVTVSTTFL